MWWENEKTTKGSEWKKVEGTRTKGRSKQSWIESGECKEDLGEWGLINNKYVNKTKLRWL